MFGGKPFSAGLLNDTWEWDGKNWTKMNPKTSPPARYSHSMEYDAARNRTVLFGGASRGGFLGDTWEYVASQSLTGSPSTISIASGGTQTLTLNAGTPNANRLYWILGSVKGTCPGVTLASAVGSVTIPLVPDIYTNITISSPNNTVLVQTKGTLNSAGQGQASLVVPKIPDQRAIGVVFYHAYLVYDANNNFYLASNPVTLTLVK